jgi:hypothetical protein
MTGQQLYTRERLASELGKDRRVIRKLLAQVEPDGFVAGGHPGWYLATVVNRLCSDQGRPLRGKDEYAIQLQRAAEELQAGLDRLKHEPSMTVRRGRLMREVGPSVGRFLQALDQCPACDSEDSCIVDKILRDHLAGQALGAFAHLLDAKFGSDGTLYERSDETHSDSSIGCARATE